VTVGLTIGDVADVLRGTTPANTIQRSDGIGFFGLAEISNGGIVTRSPEQEPDWRRAVTLQEGDIVIALLGKIGQVAIIDATAAGSILGRECAAIRIRPSEDGMTARWLYLALQSDQIRGFLESLATGSTMPRLSVKALAGVRVPAPALAQQNAAGDQVSKFDDAIRAHERVLAVLRTLRSTEIDLALWSAENPTKTVQRKIRGKALATRVRR
jgi:restriction endonuclease S subunit